MTMGTLGRLAAGLGFSLLASCSVVAAQGASPADPWSQVPALPTTYYRDFDFETRINTAEQRNNAELTRQGDVNTSIKARFDTMDQGEKMQRMQEFMMKNPQQAMQVMQAMQAGAGAVTAPVTASQGDLERLERELATLTADFQAAVKRVRDPVQRSIDELVKAKGKACGEGDCVSLPAADVPRYKALYGQLNTDYENICGAWWGPSGSFPKWLGNYKQYLLNDVVAPAVKADSLVLQQMAMMGVPGTGFRSTAPLSAVSTYLAKLNQVYALRPHRIETPTPQAR